MEKARNDIKMAELNRSRTVITAPFNAVVTDESVEVGQLLNTGSEICELVGTDEFWIQVTIPFSQLKWVHFPDDGRPGAAAQVILDTGDGEPVTWEGEVVRLLGDLDPLYRMVRLVVSVRDPLRLREASGDKLPLLLGSFVEVRIDAGELENALTIPRAARREGDRIWVVGEDHRLRILPATVLWPEKDTLIIENNVRPGDQLIVSDLRVALPGMEIDPQPVAEYSQPMTSTAQDN
jgi:multidrug efflux pump subunit AcrA (membrane-fusion protein)